MSHEVSLDFGVAEAQQDLESYDNGAQALAEFQTMIAQNADIIVESPRLPGVPLTFGALMNACPEPVTEENAAKFLAEGWALLQTAKSKDG